MGLLTGLLTLPLAPVRGTIWIAEQLALEAARELGDEQTVRRRLAEAERNFELGHLSADQYELVEDALLERLEQLRQERRPAHA